MPVALRELLDAAAPTSERRVDPAVVWSRGRRRRRVRRLTIGVGVVVLVALGGSAVAWFVRDPDPTVSTDEGDPSPGDPAGLPEGWTAATENLTPQLTDPAQVFAAATYPLRPGDDESRCAHNPMNAIRDLGPSDGLVSVTERADTSMAGTADFPPLTVPPADDRYRNNDESSECLDQPKDFEHWWIPFSLGGRVFYGYVAFGNEAAANTREEAWAILASFSPPLVEATAPPTSTTAYGPGVVLDGPISTRLAERAGLALPAGLTVGEASDVAGTGYIPIERNGEQWGTLLLSAPTSWRGERTDVGDLEPGRIEAIQSGIGRVDALLFVDGDGWIWSIDVASPDVLVPWRYDESAAVTRAQLEFWLAETVQPGFNGTGAPNPPPPTIPGQVIEAPPFPNATPVSPLLKAQIGVAAGGEPIETDFWLTAGNGTGPSLCHGEPRSCGHAFSDSLTLGESSSSNSAGWTFGAEVATVAFSTADGTRYEIPVARPFANLGVLTGAVEAHLPCHDIVGTVDRLAADGSVVESEAPPCAG